MRPWTAAAAGRRPDHPFLELPDRTVSFGEFDLLVRSTIGGLGTAGVEQGDRVGIWARNDLESAVALAAVPRAGAIAVPVDPRLGPVEATQMLALASASAVVGPDRIPDVGVPRLDPSALLAGSPRPGVEPEPGATHSIVFTSGSAGRPKGVRLTWANLEASAAASASHLRHREDDRWLLTLPLCHVGGLMVLVRSARQGSTVVLEPRFDPGRTAELLAEGGVTLASVVAVMLGRVLEVDPGPYRGVRAVLVGGGGAPLELLRAAAEAGIPVLPTYGMTETAAQIATARLEDGLHPRLRVFPLPGAEVSIEAGRIRVRGPMVSPGYLGEPNRPAGAWLDTGDLGELDPEGGLRVLGRADDVIVTGGEKVHPHEVEQALREHPEVVDVCVVGVADPTWGERVVAVYEGGASAGDLERLARYRLAGFKVPKRWLRVESLPRLAVGKVDRSAVRRIAGGR